MKENNNIQLFAPTYRIDECLAEIRQCLEVGWTGLGFKTIDFENAWKNYTGLPHAHYLNSASAGLHLAIRLLKKKHGWADGDEVISTPLTFVSTNHAILYENLSIAFADVDETGCLDPASIEERIGPKTRAVMFVGLGGNTGQFRKVEEICRRNNICLILDAAHMAGTRLEGRIPGAEADAVVYSFQAVKNLATADSGMLCFRDEELDRLARQQSWLGIDKDTFSRTLSSGSYKWYYDVPELGFKFHGNSILAAIGLVQLKYLDIDNAYRRQICIWYDEMLKNIRQLKRVPIAEGCESSRHLYQIRVKNRDEVLLALNNAGIFPGVHYRDNTEFTMYSHNVLPCPQARAFSNEVISLPLHLRMTRADVERIGEALTNILSRSLHY
ncbi:DegT/DnrJ/EryC1/StrS family aminotransferase [Methylobacterium aerolatum]|uniref:dTDP-4-amino-4,6-dideoxygalactose transaminase n=1 Tax=Methylobacterium aerolatum TaxID=418708 RepID=A0ABU0HX90_9HYPH|nr:DegT/DnrJ/EryC1/StrS family aminotransferase [Methylobacterium aerolatum]MDQ0446099.1 dTDP-4-amino-4,6-dideoxygalactose transaminase [Methylobacterium aerolatum]GJD35135.1 UDP-4-amino-4-deoxy-L-arabinose--oxoglutarate aminotransferase [Methylobacterium aerolatum]